MVIIPFLFYKKATKNQSSYYLAERKLTWKLPALSIFSTHTATDTPVWISGIIYNNGLRGLWYTFFVSWYAISAFVSTKVFRRSLAYSQAEYQKLRFGGLGSELLRGWIAGWQIFMNMFIVGWVSIAMGKVCAYMFGWPIWVGSILPTLIVFFYVQTSGYWGVVVSTFQQFIILSFVIILVSIWSIISVGGPSHIISALSDLGELWRLNPFYFDNDFTMGWLLTMPVIAIIGGIGMGTSIDWYIDAQRIASTRTIKDASYAMWYAGFFTMIRNALFALAILAFYAAYPFEFSTYGELAWFRMGSNLLPYGLLGLFFVGIVAIHFSTISAHLNLGTLYATRDIYHHYIDPEASEKKLINISRINTFMILTGSIFFSQMIGEKITSWLVYAMWLIVAGLWLPNILQVIWWRFNAWGYLSAWIANLAISWIIVWILPSLGIISHISQEYQFWLIMLLCLPIYIICTYLTKAEDKEKLAIYYAMTRPPGFWKPIRNIALEKGYISLEDDAIVAWKFKEIMGLFFSVMTYITAAFGIVFIVIDLKKGIIISIFSIIAGFLTFKIFSNKLNRESTHYLAMEGTYRNFIEDTQKWDEKIESK
jgi:Na+/proline symporter